MPKMGLRLRCDKCRNISLRVKGLYRINQNQLRLFITYHNNKESPAIMHDSVNCNTHVHVCGVIPSHDLGPESSH